MIKNIKVNTSKCKKISAFVLTTTLIMSLSTVLTPKSSDLMENRVSYVTRVSKYKDNNTYDENISSLYDDSKIQIDGVLYPTYRFFININTTEKGNEFHLINIKSEYNDILINSMEDYPHNNCIRFCDTTAFINLINSDCVLIDYENNIINIIDKEKALDIINNWDGYIHDKVAETDAVENKDYLRR